MNVQQYRAELNALEVKRAQVMAARDTCAQGYAKEVLNIAFNDINDQIFELSNRELSPLRRVFDIELSEQNVTVEVGASSAVDGILVYADGTKLDSLRPTYAFPVVIEDDLNGPYPFSATVGRVTLGFGAFDLAGETFTIKRNGAGWSVFTKSRLNMYITTTGTADVDETLIVHNQDGTPAGIEIPVTGKAEIGDFFDLYLNPNDTGTVISVGDPSIVDYNFGTDQAGDLHLNGLVEGTTTVTVTNGNVVKIINVIVSATEGE